MAIAVVCSIALHLLLLSLLVVFNRFTPSFYVKRGEPLFVDIAPEKPQEKAPLGDPARPVGPEREEPPPQPATPPPAPRPKVAEAPPAPKPPAPKVTPPRPAPEPPKQVAKAEPPPPKPEPAPVRPEPAPRAPEPAPDVAAPRPPEPQPTPPPPVAPDAPAPPQPAATPTPQPQQPPATAEPAPRAPQPSAPPSPGQTVIARPPPDVAPGIFRTPPGGGGGLRGGGRGGVEGEPIPLDTPEPRYQDYFNKIRERIKKNWIYPREAGERGIQGDLLIEFHIAKDGRLQFIELRRSSGEEILDRFALNAVRLAQPFPPVPDDIAKQVLAVNGLFRYQIVSGFVNQFLR